MIDLSLSDDQRQIVDSIVDLLAEKSPVSRLRPSGKPVDVHGDLVQWGWFGIGLPEEQGGLGLGIAEEVLLHFEAGRFLLSTTVLATTLAVRLSGNDRTDLLSGEKRAALALADGDDAYVFDRGDASLLVVFEGGEIWLVPADAFNGENITGFDETLDTKKGTLDRGKRLGAEPADRALLLVSAVLAGIARSSCDLAVEYAKIREQFGQPIGAFQAIKHMCSDMGARAYAAEAQTKMAAVMADATPQAAGFDISAAVLTALGAARDNAADAIQVHGGIGFTAECDAHFYLKRAHVLGRVLGGPEACRDRILVKRLSGAA